MEINQVAFYKVVRVIFEKIMSLKNVDINKVDKNAILLLAQKAAMDLLIINYTNYEDFGMFDEFTADQLGANCRVGELQVHFDEYLGTKITVSRYGDESLNDIEIQLVNRDNDVLAVIETLHDKTYSLREGRREMRFQDGTLKFQADNGNFYNLVDITDIDLSSFIDTFRSHKIDALVSMGNNGVGIEGPKLH